MQNKSITIEEYPRNPDATQLTAFFEKNIIPLYDIKGALEWQASVQTNPDSYIHGFTLKGTRYVLAYDDHPSGFSVYGDACVQPMKLVDGHEVLHIATDDNQFEMNITGSFMLFRVVNEKDFDNRVEYLQMKYTKLLEKWHGSGGTVAVARDIVQIAETAAFNHDTTTLHSLQNIVDAYVTYGIQDTTVDMSLLKEYIDILNDLEFGYELYDQATKDAVSKQLYKSLSREPNHQVTAAKYLAGNIGRTVTLVSAIYGKEVEGTTSGITAVFTMSGSDIEYPLEHFINSELKNYFANNHLISASNIQYHMPEMLAEYKLVEGTVEAKKIFRRELQYISF